MFQRTPYDRRRCKAKTRFPIQDSNGELVREDRRVLPDRRPEGIQAEWDEIIHDADRPAVSGSL
jgi:hypothetical protein